MQYWFVGLTLAALAAAQAATSDICLPKNVTHFSTSLTIRQNATGHWTVSAIAARTVKRGANEGMDLYIEKTKRSYEEVDIVEVKASFTLQPTEGYTELKGLGWYKHYPNVANWIAARDTCTREGADLVVPDSPEKMKRILDKFPFQNIWLGVYDPGHNKTWITVKGDAVPSQWGSPEKWRWNEGYCLYWSEGVWMFDCNYTLGFVCELH